MRVLNRGEVFLKSENVEEQFSSSYDCSRSGEVSEGEGGITGLTVVAHMLSQAGGVALLAFVH